MSPLTTSKPPQSRPRRRLLIAYSSLLAWRQAHNFTQREAAAYIGISQSYYVKLETRLQTPRPGMLKTLRDKTGVPVDELMGIAS
jgi:transcriptional regulator with XRE-family HTH domain